MDARLIQNFKSLWEQAGPKEREYIRDMIDGPSVTTRQLNDQARRVLDFLNRRAGRNYRATEVNLKEIRNRLKSGIEEDQLRQIVAKKCREWYGTDMEAYLRPKTLFSARNCENYVGELVA